MANSVVAIDQIAQGIAEALAEQREASAEIAGNVAKTVDAANALSERIMSMTGDVSTNFECAAEAHMAANDVAKLTQEMLDNFQSSITAAVRTSSTEVNRRRSKRLPLEVAARLSLNGEAGLGARTADISDHGARLILPRHADPERIIGQGTRGTIELPATPMSGGRKTLGCTVSNIRRTGGTLELGISFDVPIKVVEDSGAAAA
jgi:hypothetical protein